MADRGDTHYHVPNLNKWFALSSLLLLVTTVWMVIDDWNAPWKKYQREFRDLEVARAEQTLESPEFQAAAQEEERLRADLQRAMGVQDEREADLRKLEEELVQVDARRFVATERAKKLKQELNFQVFLIEEHRIHTVTADPGMHLVFEYRLRRIHHALGPHGERGLQTI